MGFYQLHWASPAQLFHTHPWSLWACHQSPTLFACIALGLSRPILTFFSYHTLPMGLLFAISLFSSSFEPICFLKAHLFISWTYDPLFLPLGLNGFYSLPFANFFSVCVVGLGFLPFIRVPQKRPSTIPKLEKNIILKCIQIVCNDINGLMQDQLKRLLLPNYKGGSKP